MNDTTAAAIEAELDALEREQAPAKLSGAQRKNQLRQRGITTPPSIVQRGRPRAGKRDKEA